MTESSQMNNTSDRIAALTKEAENLKLKLEEERQKLNDESRKMKNGNTERIVTVAFYFTQCRP